MRSIISSPMSSVAILEDRAVIAVSGPEARDFLQGLVTNDLRSLAQAKPLYAALLTPQGKVLFDFLLIEQDGGIMLDCAAALAEPLMKRLQMYRLRSKVTIERRADLGVVAFWNGSETSTGDIDPRLAALGRRSIVPRGRIDKQAGGTELYLAHRLKCGDSPAPARVTTLADLVLDVLAVNQRAQALYRRLGLSEVARHGEGNLRITMRTSRPLRPEG